MSNLALYVVTVAIWGSSWLVINFQLGVVAPEVSIAYRFAIAAGLLFAWCLVRRRPLGFTRHDHLRFVLLGTLLFGFNYIAAYVAQMYIISALNAVVFSSMMWLNVINSRLFFGTRIAAHLWLGALLGMGGILALFWPEVSELAWTDRTLLGAGISLAGALSASLGNIASKAAQERGLPVLQSNAWGMFYGAVLTAAVALARGVPFNFDGSVAYVGSLLYLALFGSAFAFGAYLQLVGRIGPHQAGYAVVLFPVVAVVLSIMLEGLSPRTHTVVGVVLVLIGNLVILGWRRPRAGRGDGRP